MCHIFHYTSCLRPFPSLVFVDTCTLLVKLSLCKVSVFPHSLVTHHAALVPHVSLGCFICTGFLLAAIFLFSAFCFFGHFHFVKARLLFFNLDDSVSSCFSTLHSDDVGPKIIRSLLDVKAKPHR